MQFEQSKIRFEAIAIEQKALLATVVTVTASSNGILPPIASLETPN